MSVTRIDLYQPIGGWFGMTASDMRQRLEDSAGADIELHIHSDGGCCFEGFAIANVLAAYPGRKTAVIDGMCGSAAVGIALMCDVRKANVASMWMTHLPWAMTCGTADDHEANAGVLRQITDCMAKLYSARTGKDEATVRGWMAMGRDTYWTPDQALAAGLATEIIDLPLPAMAQADVSKYLASRKGSAGRPAPAVRAGRSARTQGGGGTMNYLEKLGLSADAKPADIAAAILTYCQGDESDEDKKSTLSGLITQLSAEPDGDEGEQQVASLRVALDAVKSELQTSNARIAELEAGKAAAVQAAQPKPEDLAELAVKAGRWPANQKAALAQQYAAGSKPYLFDAGTFSSRGMNYTKGGNPQQPQVEPKNTSESALDEGATSFLNSVNGRSVVIDPKAFAAAKAKRAAAARAAE